MVRDGRFQEAVTAFQVLLKKQPDHAEARNYLGIALMRLGMNDQAILEMQRSVELAPNNETFHHNLGAALRIAGRFHEAEDHYKRAIKLKPDYAEAYFNLSAVRRFEKDDPIIPMLDFQLNRTDLDSVNNSFIQFAAGKIFDDTGEYDRAFEAYCAGNAAMNVAYDITADIKAFDMIIDAFSKTFFASAPVSGITDQRPIFVVGMPRSGTTLVEQILASHENIYGAGELPDIESIADHISHHLPDKPVFPAYAALLNVRLLRGFGEAYLGRTGSMAPEALRLVDKMPGNFRLLGLIALMFPCARVIHCTRDPLDTCLSCYFQRFRSAHEYSYDLKNLGLYYVQYARLMDHWREVLPVNMLEINYSDMIDRPEQMIRELVEFTGLTFDERCLRFYESDRPVTTASNMQVRQPINRKGLNRWQNYEKHLGTLKASPGLLADQDS